MFTSLRIEGYRAFEHFRLDDLAPVNLLVGRNCSGKTTILEAVHLHATNGDVSVLVDTAIRRGEVIEIIDEPARQMRESFANITHFFHGHGFSEGTAFEIGSNGMTTRVEVRQATEKETKQSMFVDNPLDEQACVLSIADKSFAMSLDGALKFRTGYGPHRMRENKAWKCPVQFITTDSLDPALMSEMWNRALADSKENELADAMRILDPNINNIVFLSGSTARSERSPALVALKNSKQRIPLGSLGEGVYRFLALSLSLTQVENGILLVDEIDTGLHHSVLGQMWLLVVKAAINSNVQVFATTHSLDCIKGLAWLCESHPDLGKNVALHKIHTRLDQSVTINSKNIVIAAEQGIEVR